MNLNNKVYDVLKWIAMYLLPAVGTLYFALARYRAAVSPAGPPPMMTAS